MYNPRPGAGEFMWNRARNIFRAKCDRRLYPAQGHGRSIPPAETKTTGVARAGDGGVFGLIFSL